MIRQISNNDQNFDQNFESSPIYSFFPFIYSTYFRPEIGVRIRAFRRIFRVKGRGSFILHISRPIWLFIARINEPLYLYRHRSHADNYLMLLIWLLKFHPMVIHPIQRSNTCKLESRPRFNTLHLESTLNLIMLLRTLEIQSTFDVLSFH